MFHDKKTQKTAKNSVVAMEITMVAMDREKPSDQTPTKILTIFYQ